MQELARLGVPTDVVEPRILGMVQGTGLDQDLLAVPLNTALRPALATLRSKFLDENEPLVALFRQRTVRMPTAGVTVEARLGACEAAEPFILQTRETEVRLRSAQAKRERGLAQQEDAEGRRQMARVEAGELEPATPPVPLLHVSVDSTTGP
jgi:hypothetical protein